ncbi:MAG TPA: C69 family dipeptidase [Synergistaceae bacterium]|nr:C69 family dipeptidase [Synergistaceae bacterium]HPQ37190.1 C69 family dipeptidase [Synergistaceae bacterium]
MKRKYSRFFGIALCIILALSAAAQGCTTVIVGKNRSSTGAVMVAHNEELGMNAAQHLVVVKNQSHEAGSVFSTYSEGSLPQPEKTWGYIASKVFDKEYYPGDFTTGVNEWGVTIANNMSWTREVPEETAWDTLPGGIIWTEFTQLVLERAKTAREGVELLGHLCETYHLSADPGTMFAVADPDEGWWVEIAREGQWIAVRVPDEVVSVRANGYRIGSVDLEDSEKVLHSPNVVTFAQEKGWYDPAEGPFHFAKAYGDPWVFDDYNVLRHTLVEERLGQMGKISPKDLMETLRWNYEDTEYYVENEETGSPWEGDYRTIARLNTEISAVVELRKDLPREVGSLIWWCMNTPKTGVFLPWYFGTTAFPEAFAKGTDRFDNESAYWRFFELKMLAHQNYKVAFPLLDPLWNEMEKTALEKQGEIEKQALALYKEKGPGEACAFLTNYSNSLAEEAFEKAEELITEIKTQGWFQE